MKSTRLPLPAEGVDGIRSLQARFSLVIQIDSIHMDENLILVAAIGTDATMPVPTSAKTGSRSSGWGVRMRRED
jgi:hypothetical protein